MQCEDKEEENVDIPHGRVIVKENEEKSNIRKFRRRRMLENGL